jgi:hypothetical protein
MRILPLLSGLVLTAGCGQQSDLEGPAPAGVLDCSLAYALDAGYQLVDGGADDGFLRLAQRIEPQLPDSRTTRPDPSLGDAATVESADMAAENEILVRVDGDRTRFTIVENVRTEASALTGSTAMDQALTMRDMCTSIPPTPPPPTSPL